MCGCFREFKKCHVYTKARSDDLFELFKIGIRVVLIIMKTLILSFIKSLLIGILRDCIRQSGLIKSQCI